MQRTKPAPVSVFQFLDAREYLRQAYEAGKRANPAFSQRYIAQVLKAASSSFFRDVLSGKSKLTPARVLGFARLFRLSKPETTYFENLVQYTQAETEAEKRHALDKLKAAVPQSRYTLLGAFQTEYFSKWHYAAVRELLAVYDFRGDYEELARQLNPAISAAEAREAVHVLLRLKLVCKTPHGGLDPVDRVVLSGETTPANMRPAILGNLELARRALDQFVPKERPFSYFTVSVSEDSLRQIQEKLQALGREVFELVTKDQDVDRLYQLNLQFFPVSEIVTRRKK